MYRARSIPAWAGETSSGLNMCAMWSVYPRVGGGNSSIGRGIKRATGLSPRGRGKLHSRRYRSPLARSIPAWAGETSSGLNMCAMWSVYPRVGGGNSVEVSTLPSSDGLSPRGRGKLAGITIAPLCCGSIPAWAGETCECAAACAPIRVYPRVGGGNSRRRKSLSAMAGLSPRGRGKLPKKALAGTSGGSIPAWAGETCKEGHSLAHKRVYPRVGGGNGRDGAQSGIRRGLSPRGRGKPEYGGDILLLCGSIPAWAGETYSRREGRRLAPVYPRVGGGNAVSEAETALTAGLSPRGRGKPPSPTRLWRTARSIPAWAGETQIA